MLDIAAFSILAPEPFEQLVSLSGRVAVITGGTRGIGEAIVGRLAQAGVRPTGFLAAYGAAKAGLMAVTRSMAKELGEHGILVNAVIPGATLTAERIKALKSGHLQGPFQAVPADAPKTLEKQRDLLEKGGFAQVLSHLPWAGQAFPMISPRQCFSWPRISPATLVAPRLPSTARKHWLEVMQTDFSRFDMNWCWIGLRLCALLLALL
jgi:hypothetical protein